MKDQIDFEKERIGVLFKRMFLPTLFGMVFSMLFVITDGIFVGQGIGSDALAAINIDAPIMLLSSGIGLMFGMGASVVVAVHLSHGKLKTARINMTQCVLVSSILLIACSVLILVFREETLSLLGCSARLHDLALDYLIGFVPFLSMNAILCSGGFFIRLEGFPTYAMLCSIVASVINMILDYVYIFIFKWGVFGAAVATSTGLLIGSIMIFIFLCRQSNNLHFVRFKTSKKSLCLTLRNVKYMCKLGFSSFLSENSIALLMFCGNYVFMDYTGEDGVAAFSISCYIAPIVFMLYNSIAQSSQPIISYNYGIKQIVRVKTARNLALKVALGSGIALLIASSLFSGPMVSLFISSSSNAYKLATSGFPIFAIEFIPLAINVVLTTYFQSVEQVKKATCITILRGYIFMIACFVILPKIWGVMGIWLAIPSAEALTLLVCLPFFKRKTIKHSILNV